MIRKFKSKETKEKILLDPKNLLGVISIGIYWDEEDHDVKVASQTQCKKHYHEIFNELRPKIIELQELFGSECAKVTESLLMDYDG